MKSKRTHHGFTIIELLLSISILAILVTLAAPMFGDNDALQLDVTKRLLMSDLEYTQILAIANPDDEIALVLSSEGDGWIIASTSSPTVPLEDSITGEALHTSLQDGSFETSNVTIQCNDIDRMIVFDPNGGLTDFTQETSFVLACGDSTTEIVVSPTTGSIQ